MAGWTRESWRGGKEEKYIVFESYYTLKTNVFAYCIYSVQNKVTYQ